ncbi:MAG: R.Pab1 family restriction endonuclease [Rickettsiales bacterium]|nr:MAG: R.Pab1 family restriction endonuclease [Rickettsiales bacterium]
MFNLNEQNKEIAVKIPLTTTNGKIRVKERSMLNEYGLPVATKQIPFNQKMYIEWQIGYENDKATTLSNKTFINSNGKNKALYELSEYLYYFYKWNVITKNELQTLKDFIENTDDTKLIDVNNDYNILRSHFKETKLFGIDFLQTEIKYPLLVHKFAKFDIITEIIIKEKQQAIGVMPMLYLCFPITELKANLLSRVAKTKEVADFVFNKNNVNILLEMVKIFGILSSNHKQDILSIMEVIENE